MRARDIDDSLKTAASSVILTLTADAEACRMTRVLIVDHAPAVRPALDRALRLDGYEITLAADGREALDSLADTRHDAVVLDVAMPGIDGLPGCRGLRAAGD